MKTAFLFLLLLLQTPLLFAQVNCKTVKQRDGSTLKKCFHKNGKISTLETWDKDKRHGNLKGFNNKGEEIFSYSLRRYGGSASAQITYFPNGQVKGIYYSDAPDGGIQYYHSTSQFDRAGNQVSFEEDSHEDKLKLKIPIRDTVK